MTGEFGVTLDFARLAALAFVEPLFVACRVRRLLFFGPGTEELRREFWTFLVSIGRVRLRLFTYLTVTIVFAPISNETMMLLHGRIIAVIYAARLLNWLLNDIFVYPVVRHGKGLKCGVLRYLRFRFAIYAAWKLQFWLVMGAIWLVWIISQDIEGIGWFRASTAGALLYLAALPFGNYIEVVALGARNRVQEELDAAVRDVARREGIREPELRVFSDVGTKFPGAFALPSLVGPSYISFSEYLLSILTPEERFAVAMHELGHLQRGKIVPRFFFAIFEGCALIFIFGFIQAFSSPAIALVLVWGVNLLFPILVGHFRSHEVAADCFAAKHAGPDAAISSLTKINEASLLPSSFEGLRAKPARHPSLKARKEKILQFARKHGMKGAGGASS